MRSGWVVEKEIVKFSWNEEFREITFLMVARFPRHCSVQMRWGISFNRVVYHFSCVFYFELQPHANLLLNSCVHPQAREVGQTKTGLYPLWSVSVVNKVNRESPGWVNQWNVRNARALSSHGSSNFICHFSMLVWQFIFIPLVCE